MEADCLMGVHTAWGQGFWTFFFVAVAYQIKEPKLFVWECRHT